MAETEIYIAYLEEIAIKTRQVCSRSGQLAITYGDTYGPVKKLAYFRLYGGTEMNDFDSDSGVSRCPQLGYNDCGCIKRL